MVTAAPVSVLVVDDDPAFARSLQILLEDEGRCQVSVADSVEQMQAALSTARQVDVVIIELAMLETGHGLEMLRRHGNLAVILMTAHRAALQAARCRGVQAAAFLSKPVEPDTLLAAVCCLAQ